MIKKILIVILVLISSITYAQEASSSPYSFYGVGVQKFKGTAENRAMGGLSVYSDSIHLNLQNPAAYGGLKLTTYSLGASYESLTLESANQSEKTDNATVDYLAIGIPVGKFGFGFGLVPFTAVGYQLKSIEGTEEARFSGTGGLNKVFLSVGYEVFEGFNLGIDANYNFGNIESKEILIREGVSRHTRRVDRSDLSGFGFTFGAQYKKIFENKMELYGSLAYTPSTNLKSENSAELATIAIGGNSQEIVFDSQDLTVLDRDLNFSEEYKLGVGVGKSKSWFVGAEYVMTNSSEIGDRRNFSRDDVVYEDATRMSLGGFYIPKYNSLTSYFKRVVYRAGVRFEETGLNIDNQSIEEFGISFGVGLPIGNLFSNANIGFEYGQRGTTAAGLVKEDFFNVSIGLSLNDKWFRKLKFN